MCCAYSVRVPSSTCPSRVRGRRLGGATSPAGFRLAPDRADAGLAVSQDLVAGLR